MGKELAVPAFDYSELDSEIKGKLQSLARDINRGLTQFKDASNDIGKAVCEAHRLLADHRKGLFDHWIEAETGIGRSTAYNLKNLRERSADYPIIGQLPPTVGYLMAAPSVPAEAIREVEKAVNKGQRPTVEFAKATLDRFKEVVAKSNGRPPRSASAPAPSPPAAPDLGKCPNCGGKKWKDDGLGDVCAKCKHPHGEAAGDADDHRAQAIRDHQSKLVKTMEAGMRAVGELYDLVRNDAKKAEANRLLKIVLHMGKDWLK